MEPQNSTVLTIVTLKSDRTKYCDTLYRQRKRVFFSKLSLSLGQFMMPNFISHRIH